MIEKRLAIIGAGVMGGNHVRVASENNDFSVAYVVDRDIERASQRAGAAGAIAVASVEEINFDTIDAAIVAAPSHLHGEIGETLISNGIHVLMEKPLSLSLAEAQKLHDLSNQFDTRLMVGHIELFNPTITKLIEEIGDRAIKSFRAERLGFVEDPSRLYHGVVDDLMLHDIAIARHVIGGDLDTSVVAAIGRNESFAAPDPAQAFVMFNHTDAYFRASRVHGGGKKRLVEVDLIDNTTISADLLTRSIVSHHSIQGVDDNGGLYQFTETKESIPRTAEPLQLEHSFFASIIDKKTSAEAGGVSANDAMAILAITTAINRLIVKNN